MVDLNKIKHKKTTEELMEFGIININKPVGPTSFWVVDYIRKLLKLNKTSHFGTLDPKVSGVLPIALGRACRLSGYFMKKEKTYVGIMRLHDEIDDSLLEEKMKKFIGTIIQKPPVRSRVKRVERPRTVHLFEILERDKKDVLFNTHVEAGTYIRKLCDDLGKHIGGAHMLELRRTQAGIFEEKNSYTLYDLLKAFESYKNGDAKQLRKMITPGEIISKVLPVGHVKKEAIKRLFTGSPVFYDFLEKIPREKEGSIALFHQNRLIEIAKIVNEKKMFATPEFVIN